jgi:protein-tyrosine phosphatase
LLEDDELMELAIPDLVSQAVGLGLRVERLPIPDGGVPRDLVAVRQLVDQVLQAAQHGESIVIHCKGGLGRAGTIGGCVLVASGLTPQAALDALREARGPNCPETHAQRAFIRQFASAP